MKKKSLFLLCGASAVWLCVGGCSSVSSGEANAYGSMDDFIVYHTRKYAEEHPMKLPDGIDETTFPDRKGKVKTPFASLPTFEQTTREAGADGRSSDDVGVKIAQSLAEDCENKMAATNRFPVTQLRYGRADRSLRKASRDGVVRVAELDTSEMEEGKYVFNIRYNLVTKDMLSGSRNEKTVTMEWKCMLVDAKTNQPIPEMPAFSISVEDKLVQKVGRTGRVIEGVRWDSPVEREGVIMNLSRMAQLKFLNQIYKSFPVGGYLTDIDFEEKSATIRASRATGLLPDMEMIIYARKKGNDEANRIPLFNATCTPSRKGASQMTIWRSSDKSSAKKIIAMLKKDRDAAMEEYDFYAVSCGMSGPPPFIEVHAKK